MAKLNHDSGPSWIRLLVLSTGLLHRGRKSPMTGNLSQTIVHTLFAANFAFATLARQGGMTGTSYILNYTEHSWVDSRG
ncbi:hypothetical protein MMC10_011266 [Thelotrema lepadinum]|nr:hypothetical protein [Thelotrema lepadinum]